MESIESIIKSNQEQATAAWLNYLNQTRINQIVESLREQNLNLNDAVQTIKNTLQIINHEIIDANRGGPKGQHGFIAEVAECGINNAFDKLSGNKESYKWINNNGPIDIKRGVINIQQKFVISGGKFSLDAIKEHLEKYPDFLKNGGKYQIPKDFYDTVKKLYEMNEKEANAALSGNTNLTISQWKKVHAYFEDSDISINDLEPSVLKYSEVQSESIEQTLRNTNRKIHRDNIISKENDYDEGRASLEEAGQAVVFSAAIEGGTTFALEIYKKIKAGKKIKDLSNEEWAELLKKSGIGAIKGGIRGGGIYFMTNLSTYFVDMNEVYAVTTTPAAVASSLMTASFGVAEQINLYRKGKLSELELIENSELLCLNTSVSALSSLIGQAIIPIPILGAVIGNTVGTVVYQAGLDVFTKKENELFERYLFEQSQLDKDLEMNYSELLHTLNVAILNYFDLLEEAFAPAPEKALYGSIKLAEELKVPTSEILRDIKSIDSYFLE